MTEIVCHVEAWTENVCHVEAWTEEVCHVEAWTGEVCWSFIITCLHKVINVAGPLKLAGHLRRYVPSFVGKDTQPPMLQ